MEIEKFAHPDIDSILPFMEALELVRQELSPESWKTFLSTHKPIRAWRYFLCNDPYTRWAYIKPKGYAGDATVMDFAYGHVSIKKEVEASSSLGKIIYSHTSLSKQSDSARLRIELIASELNKFCQAANASNGTYSVASYASGHGREFEKINQHSRMSIKEIQAIDSDKNSLNELLTSATGLPVQLVNRNVFRYDFGNKPAFDFVYSLGLFDYLENKQATYLVKRMWAALQSGGKMLIANLSHEAGNIGYCEAIMDWWMITRSHNDMLSLVEAIDSNEIMAIKNEKIGCFHYLSVEKQ